MDEEVVITLPKIRWWKKSYSVAGIIIIALLLRLWAVWQLPLDADEPVYLKGGNDYAEMIKAGNWQGIINYEYNREHPALVKLIYSIPYLIYEAPFGSNFDLIINRLISVVFGIGAVFIISSVDPLAGLFLAFHTMTIKYTSEVYLEALPLLAILGCVLLFQKAQRGGKRWLWVSAILLGIAGACKYTYLMIVFTLVYMWISKKGLSWKQIVGYLGIAIAAFFVFNPTLWFHPFERIITSITYHASYTHGSDVLTDMYPWYQPITWIIREVPWHPQVFFFLGSDTLIFWLTILGSFRAIKKHSWELVWFGSCLLILLIWPTKWPQYSLILTVPMCLIASDFVRAMVHWVKVKESYWEYLKEMLPVPPKAFWIILILLGVGLLGGKLYFEIQMAILRRGWISIAAEVTPLPSNSVHDIKISKDGNIVLATANGISFWKPDESSPWGKDSIWLSPTNSDMVGSDVFTILQDQKGAWWIGTDLALNYFDGTKWDDYLSADLGLADPKIHAIAEDSEGNIWVGTMSGAAMWDGKQWAVYLAKNNQLMDDAIFTIEVEKNPTGDVIWFGNLGGVTRYDVNHGTWIQEDLSSYGLGWGGVTALLYTSDQRMMVGTIGGGLGIWDNGSWTFYRTSNSDIPYNNISTIYESEPGVFWLGVAYPSEPGGVVVKFTQNEWMQFSTRNSGFTGSEPVTFIEDKQKRLWIGMATNGMNIYKNPNQTEK